MPSPHRAVFIIRSDCDLAGAGDLLAELRQQVAHASPEAPLGIDFTQGRPSAVALQLAASAARSLGRKAAFGGYGDRAAGLPAPLAQGRGAA